MLAKLTGHGVTPDGTIKTNAYLMATPSLGTLTTTLPLPPTPTLPLPLAQP